MPQTCYQFCSGVRKPLDPPNIPIIFLCVFLQDPIEFVWVFFGWRKNGVLFLSGMSKAIVLTDFPGYLRGRTTKRCRKTSSLGGPTRDRDHGFKPLRNDPSGGHRSSGSPPIRVPQRLLLFQIHGGPHIFWKGVRILVSGSSIICFECKDGVCVYRSPQGRGGSHFDKAYVNGFDLGPSGV